MSELRFDGRVALVTGGGRGLGSAYARLFASRGASVVVNDPGVDLVGDGGDRRPAQQVVDDIVRSGGKAVANFASVASKRGALSMVTQACEAFGRLDIVVNNAGIFTARHPFEQSSTGSFEKLWRVHVLGSVNVIRAAWPQMKRQRYGRIVNVASHAGYLGFRGNIEYSTAKGAIHGLTRALSLESSEHGIAVNAVAPFAMTRPVRSFLGDPDESPKGPFAIDLPASLVCWMAHETCQLNGEVLGSIAGTSTRIKVAETAGHLERSPTPEAIREHFDRILDQQALDRSGLVFGDEAEAVGMARIARYGRGGDASRALI